MRDRVHEEVLASFGSLDGRQSECRRCLAVGVVGRVTSISVTIHRSSRATWRAAHWNDGRAPLLLSFSGQVTVQNTWDLNRYIALPA